MCMLDSDVERRKIRLSDGDMHLDKEETMLHLNRLEELKKAKMIDLQADVALKRLQPQHVPVIMEQYRLRCLDALYFETGIEEEDLEMGKIHMRITRKKIKKGAVPEKNKLECLKPKVQPGETKPRYIWGQEFEYDSVEEREIRIKNSKEKRPEEESKKKEGEKEITAEGATESPAKIQSEESGEN